jgi:hypothetical protein
VSGRLDSSDFEYCPASFEIEAKDILSSSLSAENEVFDSIVVVSELEAAAARRSFENNVELFI